MALNLEHLRAFLVVVEEGSINRAAARLLRAQPAVGRQIRLLEESLGAALLHRSSQGVQPTAAGARLIEHAKRIFQNVAEAEAAIAHLESVPSGDVTVALPTSLIDQLGVRLFTTMQERFPLVRLEVLEGDSHAIKTWMREGTASLALLPEGHSDTSLHSMELATQVFCFCGRFDHVDSLPESISLSEVLSYPLALSLHPNRLRRLIDTAAQGVGQEVRPIISTSTGLVSLLLKEGGIYTIRPRIGAMPATVDGLSFIPIRDPSIQRSLCVVWGTQETLQPAAEVTRATLVELVQALAPPI
ncbi:LysR family transcriptional regulator [Hydrogenophaga sp. BPS33]|uniref:LysR family transcriptional regulator n=1 Tax=Hydrogenophaga sp. BPS33 TaxID=2651974 RepID=UPI00131FC95F|nr:LysR family transcriptional regulator [Hydrogenophaga sp. BPS33]QHE85463.1 LysR family transcriptional regulator [Hydrogenophaga sp. BPS33]